MMSDEGSTGLDYETIPELAIETAAQLKALGDPLRLTIADLVLERAMTVTELADRLHRPRGTVAHHVDVLVDAGLLQVVRTRKVRAIEERFYGRTATTYLQPHTPDEMPFVRAMLGEVDYAKQQQFDAYPSYATLRHARIPPHRAAEFRERLEALALEFLELPRAGEEEYGLYLALYPTTRLS